MIITNSFEKEHYGVWANAKTEGQVIIKASKHGDYVEFNECELSCTLGQPNAEGTDQHLLQDRYEIASLTSNEDKATFEIVLRKFKEDVEMVLEFKNDTLRLSRVSDAEEAFEEDKCEFTKILSE